MEGYMSVINLTDGRWRWRRNGGPATIEQMMVPAAQMAPSGTFTDTLLRFTPQDVGVPAAAASLFPQGIPGPAEGTWYKGTVETHDKYVDPLDNNYSLGTFWAKLWDPTPTQQGTLTMLLFQYDFAVPGVDTAIDTLGVRIFTGHLSKKPEYVATFYGHGIDNWVPGTLNTFTLTHEGWDEMSNTNIE
jgi:hypothetical protein